MNKSCRLVVVLLVPFFFDTVKASEFDSSLVEADWLRQAQTWRNLKTPKAPLTFQDSLGAVDGVKNGQYGFHTGQTPHPWWQVDLEKVTPVAKILVYNRLDYEPGIHHTDSMRVLVSDDGEQWKQIHDCAGTPFGGMNPLGPLTLTFGKGKLAARFIRLQIPSEQPIYFHLDEVEVFSFDQPGENIALWQPTDQSSLSSWSISRRSPREIEKDDESFPIEEVRERFLRFAAYLKIQGVDAGKVAAVEKEIVRSVETDAKKEYLRLRQLGRKLVFMNPLLDFDHLLFVKRNTQQTYPDICLNHMPWVSRPGGDICILDNPFAHDGKGQKVTNLIQGQLGPGHVRGIDLHWDGDRVVFGYAQQPQENWQNESWVWPWAVNHYGHERMMGHDLRLNQEPIHIYEINADGSGLRQITNHEMWSDLDPTYLPNGDIVFVSERCGFSLQCNNGPFHDETSCNLYSVKPDGTGLRWLSYNKDGDYQPHVLNDGTVGYCRWEYQERGWATIQSVWYLRPDGTGADALFKQHLDTPWAFENTREIPMPTGDRKFVSIAAAHHTLASGPVCVLTPNLGLSDSAGIGIVTPGVYPPEGEMSGEPVHEGGVVEDGGYYMYPLPLSDKFFLAAYTYSSDPAPGCGPESRGADEKGYGLYLIDVFGNKELLYKDLDISSSFPMPLRSRPTPPILPDNCNPALGNKALCSISDVTYGVDGVDPSEVKYIRIARRIGWPYTKETGGQRYEVDGSGWGLNWAPALVFGEVPVEDDGSASFYVPPNVSVYFQLLDAEKKEIKRMRSFISFQPGESRGCVGCHETRAEAPVNTQMTKAMSREPSTPTPPPWGTERCINYLVDIQPVFDRHCVSCHSGLKPAANFDFSGGLMPPGPMTRPLQHRQTWPFIEQFHFDGLNRSYRTIIENDLVVYSNKHDWASAVAQTRQFGSSQSKLIEAIVSGPCSSHINIKPGCEDWYRLVTWIDANAQYHDQFVNSRPKVPPYDMPADKDLQQTILTIHQKRCAECHAPESVSRLDWIDLTEPAASRFLVAPLSGKCGKTIYTDRNDPDYVMLQKTVDAAVTKALQFPRRDVESLLKEWNSRR
ncbi:MAG: discoidin domain-containing protein [Planctomycetaceae bacterium]|jgi:mono/diheme cytochrome c family protein|nr:discoidin domain-containing protein [Planctomycetaceae bacterium]